jgi:hypothetical protein
MGRSRLAPTIAEENDSYLPADNVAKTSLLAEGREDDYIAKSCQ